MGRPTKINENVIVRLEQGFANGFSVSEACSYADISRTSYYNHFEQNEAFKERMKKAQTDLQRKAKINLAEAIRSGDIETSKYYLERKCKDEFSTNQCIKVNGKIKAANPFEELSTEELKRLANKP